MRRRRQLLGATCAVAAVGAVSVAVAPGSATAAGHRARAAGGACGGDSVGILTTTNGERVVRISSISVCAAGSVSVSFTADSATCAASGVCGYAGTESVPLAGAGDLALTTVRRHGALSTLATLVLVPGAVSSAVSRTVAGAEPGSCSDTTGAGNAGGFFATLPSHRGRDTIALAAAGSPLLGTRCAGPITTDLRGVLPTATLPAAQLARGRRVIDLAGTRPFTAHGFTGTVRSTVSLTLGAPHRQSLHGDQPPGAHRTRVRILTVSDRIAALSGRARATVTTTAQTPSCAPLDACGLSGTLDVIPRAGPGGTLELAATAPARRPPAQLRAALGLGGTGPPRPRITVVGGGASQRPGTVAADFTQGPTACRDTLALQAVDLQATIDRTGALQLSLVPFTGLGDPLRTRCPGPDLGQHMLARALVPRAVWRRRRFAVTLHGTHFSDGPYRVAIASSLRLVLRRGRVRSKVATTFDLR